MNMMSSKIAHPAVAAMQPDAELIRTCAEHIVNFNACNNADSKTEREDGLLWHAYERTRDIIAEAQPQTLKGLLAKSRAAKAEALDPDGEERPDGRAADWAWDIINDLIRLNEGGNSYDSAALCLTAPGASPDAELITLCVEIDRLEDGWLALGSKPGMTNADAQAAEDKQDSQRGFYTDRQYPLIDKILEMRARTLEGLQARARTIVKWAPNLLTVKAGPGTPFNPAATGDELMVGALLRDLIGEARS